MSQETCRHNRPQIGDNAPTALAAVGTTNAPLPAFDRPGFAAMCDASIPEPFQMFRLKVGDIVPTAELQGMNDRMSADPDK